MPESAANFETIPSNEAGRIKDLGERLKQKIIKDNAGSIMRRDAHPKMHGLVKAEFKVESDLPEELAIGLFSEAKSYQTWVRFSNQDGSINPDIKRDIRGMAIKLMGVPGQKLLPQEKDAPTHDFITISTDVFVTKDVAEFDDLIKTVTTKSPLGQAFFFSCHLRLVKNLLMAMRKFANPLQIRYFSTTPYLLGDRAVKYSTIPQLNQADKIPSNPRDNYLREAIG